MEDLKKHVVEEFGFKDVQKFYIQKAEEGLWKTEKVIVKKYFKPVKKVKK